MTMKTITFLRESFNDAVDYISQGSLAGDAEIIALASLMILVPLIMAVL